MWDSVSEMTVMSTRAGQGGLRPKSEAGERWERNNTGLGSENLGSEDTAGIAIALSSILIYELPALQPREGEGLNGITSL